MRYAGCGERGSQGRREVQAFPAAASAAFFAAAASCFRDDDNPAHQRCKSISNKSQEREWGNGPHLFLAHNVGVGFHL